MTCPISSASGGNTTTKSSNCTSSEDLLNQLEDTTSSSCGASSSCCPSTYSSSSLEAEGKKIASDLSSQLTSSGVDSSKISSIVSSVEGNSIVITITLAPGVSPYDAISTDSNMTYNQLFENLFADITNDFTSINATSSGGYTAPTGGNPHPGKLEGYNLTDEEIDFCEENEISFKGDCTGNIHQIIDDLQLVPEDVLQSCPNGITIDFSNDPADLGAAGFYTTGEPGEINVLNGSDSYTVLHELGHLLDFEALGKPSNDSSTWGDGDYVTGYAGFMAEEDFAESFVNWTLYGNASSDENADYFQDLGIRE
ncbi:MAG: hypothetical protein A2Y40_04755 [Candidatus Margulisbacteria bacterium GWF2_35_9]|nr:MAG: hypothetical protein A2Y40_04755 [Candidatus Margulisbacteria bacterium GWF2_35_9]